MKIPTPKKLPSGNYYIQLRLGGESVSITAPSASSAKREASLVKAEYLAGKRAPKSSLTLREAGERYIARCEAARRSPETVRGYNVIMRNRFQAVMDAPVSSVDWQSAYNAEAAHLSPKTMANTWSFFSAACRFSGVPLERVTPVARQHTEHPWLEPAQIKPFVAAAAKDRFAIPILLYLSSCRASEVRGLDWRDVDLVRGRIKIDGALVRDKHGALVRRSENKTPESSRYIPIMIPELRSALEAVEDKTGGVACPPSNSVRRHINNICRELGFPEVGVHGLRHSFASLCYSLGIPEKTTMMLGGWSDYNTVVKIYTHLAKADVDKSVAALSDFFADKSLTEK